MKINLGSGYYPKKGYVNVDIDTRIRPDKIWDLNEYPYPFESNSARVIEASHVLEHLADPFRAMKEIHRILEYGGKAVIKVPHFSRGMSCPEHTRGFDVSFPYYFNSDFGNCYQGIEFTVEKIRLKWCSLPELKKDVFNPIIAYSLIYIGKVVDIFANLSPSFASRFWCYWVGGFEEIEMILIK